MKVSDFWVDEMWDDQDDFLRGVEEENLKTNLKKENQNLKKEIEKLKEYLKNKFKKYKIEKNEILVVHSYKKGDLPEDLKDRVLNLNFHEIVEKKIKVEEDDIFFIKTKNIEATKNNLPQKVNAIICDNESELKKMSNKKLYQYGLRRISRKIKEVK